MASQTQDDGFHEIQLNGKQLVFLFMAATVVSVVIFLCGVLVGRGVRAERGSTLAEASLTAAPSEPTLQRPAATPAPVGSDPTAAAPPPAEELKQPPPKTAPPAAAKPPPVEARAALPAPPPTKNAAACATARCSTRTFRPTSTPHRKITTDTTVAAMKRNTNCLPFSWIS